MIAKRLGIVVLLLMIALSIFAAEASAGHGARASGQGQFSPGRTFAFAANESGSMDAGHGALSFAGSVRILFDFDCLEVDGNAATMSGTVATGSVIDPELGEVHPGYKAWVKVIDNGEGAQADPDQMTPVFMAPPDDPRAELLTCTFDLVDIGAPVLDLLSGNVQVSE